MKLKTSLILLMTFASFSNVMAQAPKGNDFKGTITYKITYPDANLDAAQMSSMPQTMILYLNGPKSKAELKTGRDGPDTYYGF